MSERAENVASTSTVAATPPPATITETILIDPETIHIDGQLYVVQKNACTSKQLKAVAPSCRRCISKEGVGDACRFIDIRAVPVSFVRNEKIPAKKTKKGDAPDKEITVYCWPPREAGRSAACIFLTSPLDNQAAELPWHHDLNRAMDDTTQTVLLDAVAQSLLPIMSEALIVAQLPHCIRRQRELQYRMLCDMCTTGIFASSFMCTICGLEYCQACRSKIIQQSPAARLSEKRPDQIMYCGSARSRMGALRNKHFDEDLIPVTRFAIDELEEEIGAMKAVIAKAEEAKVTGSETTGESDKADDTSLRDGSSHEDAKEYKAECRVGELDASTESEANRSADEMIASADSNLLVSFPVKTLSDYVDDSERLATRADIYMDNAEGIDNSQMTKPDVWTPSMDAPRKVESTDEGCGLAAEPQQIAGGQVSDIKPTLTEPVHALSGETSAPTLQTSHESDDSVALKQASPVVEAVESLNPTAAGIRTSSNAASRCSTLTPVPEDKPLGNDIRSHNLTRHHIAMLTEERFLDTWSKGEPLVVEGITTPQSWDPQAFQDRYGNEECEIVRCDAQPPQVSASALRKRYEIDPRYHKIVHVRDFFATFGTDAETRADMLGKGIWKLKDWPPSAEFRSSFPDLYDDFNVAVPMPDYTRRDGCKNLSALFPLNANGPDLGPKMYNAWPGQHAKGKKGTTRLHMDIADAVNIMLYASETGEAVGAQWDIFRAEDAQKIRDFLWERQKAPDRASDPIHVQLHYLDDYLLEKLYETKGVYSWRIYQRPGEAVFIPAGCAHQVCNLSDCIKVAVDFLSIQNVERCFRLTEEFAALATDRNKSWKEDVLQLRAQLWYAWKTCRELGPVPSAEELQRRIEEREAKQEAARRLEEEANTARNKRKARAPRARQEADVNTEAIGQPAAAHEPADSTRSGRSVKASAASINVAVSPARESPSKTDGAISSRRIKMQSGSPAPRKASTPSEADQNVIGPAHANHGLTTPLSAPATEQEDLSIPYNLSKPLEIPDHEGEVVMSTIAAAPAAEIDASCDEEEDDDEPVRTSAKRRRVFVDDQ